MGCDRGVNYFRVLNCCCHIELSYIYALYYISKCPYLLGPSCCSINSEIFNCSVHKAALAKKKKKMQCVYTVAWR